MLNPEPLPTRPSAAHCLASVALAANGRARRYLFLMAENFDKQLQAAKASQFILLSAYILKNGSQHYGSHQKPSSDLK